MFILSRNSMKICGNYKYRISTIMIKNLKNIAQYSIKTTSNFKSARIIRKEFIDYYTNNLNHIFIPSSPVIPLCDASLAFINAGMNQFKTILQGHDKPPSSRVVNYQKCIRVGGKHNDINIVGHDTYHHTFFEMLGNWSFGDYGKEEACKYAWNMLTQLYGIDKNQLYVTYFSGDDTLGMKADIECRDIWREIGIPNDRILACGVSDNFWEMGSSGPCGSCTEIHINKPIHHADKLHENVNSNSLNLTELWNIVFIEYDRRNNGDIIPLNKQYIDTGMGFERLVTIIQGKNSNYDTDLFQPLFHAIHKLSNAPVYSGKFGCDDKFSIDTSYRIMADHARMITIALADGVIPELNHKLRRIIRRAINIGNDTFKINNLLHELTYHVGESLDDVYPEIQMKLKQIQTLINYEVELLATLKASSGMKWQSLVKIKPQLASISDPYSPGLIHSYNILQSTLSNDPNLKVLPGKIAFKLYDTHGLDLDMIEELAQIEGITVDKLGFDFHLQRAKSQSRMNITRTDNNIVSVLSINNDQCNNIAKTNDNYKYNYSYDGVNYKLSPLKSKLVAVIINGNIMSGKCIKLNSTMLRNNDKIGILLDKTIFYSYEGGQLCDKGIIYINNMIFNVTQVHKFSNYVIHYGVFDNILINNDHTDIELSIDDEIIVTIDNEYRTGLMKNHTATHLLNAALRNIFPVITQRGSIVNYNNLIFKFSTFGKNIDNDDIIRIENEINHCIQSNISIKTKTINMLQFMSEKNLTIIPDEIYPDNELRIIEIDGLNVKSKEACCGTHVHNTSVLEHFAIIDVTSKGLSSKTITAVTGEYAINELSKRESNKIMNNDISTINIADTNNMNERKNIVLKFLTSEMYKILNSTVNPYIVHCFHSHNLEVESIPLQIVTEICNMPVFLIAISNRKFKARCFVPSDYLMDNFNAQSWMEAIIKIVPIKLGSFKDEDPLMNCHTKILKLPRNEIALVTDNSIAEAKKFAATHMKQTISKNN